MTRTSFCQIFVCATPGEGRCGAKGGGELLDKFREEVNARGIHPGTVLRNACARRHHEGPVVFVYPDDVWYTEVSLEKVAEIVERHLPYAASEDVGHSVAVEANGEI